MAKGGVFYRLTARPQGLRFVSFRARSDLSIHLPERRFIETGAVA
jgi:hypothetical protein